MSVQGQVQNWLSNVACQQSSPQSLFVPKRIGAGTAAPGSWNPLLQNAYVEVVAEQVKAGSHDRRFLAANGDRVVRAERLSKDSQWTSVRRAAGRKNSGEEELEDKLIGGNELNSGGKTGHSFRKSGKRSGDGEERQRRQAAESAPRSAERSRVRQHSKSIDEQRGARVQEGVQDRVQDKVQDRVQDRGQDRVQGRSFAFASDNGQGRRRTSTSYSPPGRSSEQGSNESSRQRKTRHQARQGTDTRLGGNASQRRLSETKTRSSYPPADPGLRRDQGTSPRARIISREVEEDDGGNGQVDGQRPWPQALGVGEEDMCWRVFNVEVPLDIDPGKDSVELHPVLQEAVAARFGCKAHHLPADAIEIVRKSFDARKGLKFVYAVDVDERKLFAAMAEANASPAKLRASAQHLVRMPKTSPLASVPSILRLAASSSNRPPPLALDSEGLEESSASRRASRGPSQSHPDGSRSIPSGHVATARGARGEEEDAGPEGSTLRGPNQQAGTNEVSPHGMTASSQALVRGDPYSPAVSSMADGEHSISDHSDCREPTQGITDLPSMSDNGRKPIGGLLKGRGGRGEKARVVVVGSGPAGLFSALVLAEAGHRVTLVERGQPVEVRGRDIGALMARRQVDANSNFCYGEGGAGTWSDGKLTTRIGKNSADVQAVLRLLVQFGAPERILLDGKPHLGTDRLVRLLRSFRQHLMDQGVAIHFGTAMEGLEVRNGHVAGVAVGPVLSHPLKIPPGRSSSTLATPSAGATSGVLPADKVVLAVGHSARDVYSILQQHGVEMSAKDFAVGFRVEHPQELINEIQYGRWAEGVERGKGKLPVADYSLATEVSLGPQAGSRGCYSFCMCPGGQVVPTSTSEEELCVNGMSFSARSSRWANAALVTSVGAADFEEYAGEHGPLAGVAFQRAMEREAAARGGGAFVAPVQRVTDFMEGRLSEEPLPASSYRLGVRSARLDEIYPPPVTQALRKALLTFDRQLPGFISDSGLLHGVETRTSAPVRVERHRDTFESVSMPGLYPVGEGAGYAGGIVSAAVDGMKAGLALARQLAVGAG